MTSQASAVSMLTLHAVRLKGVATGQVVARRFGLPLGEVEELLGDFEAYGWASHFIFAGSGGWSLTDAGRRANERMLAEELAASGAAGAVRASYDAFLPLNARFQAACTRWQLRPRPGDSMAANDHTDVRWDDRVLGELASLGHRVRPLTDAVTASLPRFDGYPARYEAALRHVQHGRHSFVDGIDVDSCHRVWFELHEDFLATLGLARESELSAPT